MLVTENCDLKIVAKIVAHKKYLEKKEKKKEKKNRFVMLQSIWSLYIRLELKH